MFYVWHWIRWNFDEIPEELEKHIVEKASQLLYENEVINKHVDFKDFMSL